MKAELLKKFKEEDSQNQSGDQCGRSGMIENPNPGGKNKTKQPIG